MKKSTLALLAVVLLAILSGTTFVVAAASPNEIGASDVIRAIQGQVELLRWVGGAMVSGLCVAVVWLWKTLRDDQADAKRVFELSARADDRLADAVIALHAQLNKRPCLRKED